MAVSYPSFNRITFDEANPFLTGAKKGQDLAGEFLKNQIAAAQAKYADPMEQAKLQNQQLENQWNPQLWKSLIDLQNSQAGLSSSQIAYNKAHGGEEQIVYNNMLNQQGQQGNSGASQGGSSGGNGGGYSMPDDAGTGAQTDTPSQVHNLVMNGPSADQSQGNAPAPTQSQSQPNQQQAPQTGAYGLVAPVQTMNDIINNRMTGSDSFGPKVATYQSQLQDQFKQYQEALAVANQQASNSNGTIGLMHQFNNEVDKSTFSGPGLGDISTTGWQGGVANKLAGMVGKDLTHDAKADYIETQLLPNQISSIKQAMGQGQFSVVDMHAAQQMTLRRNMPQQTRQDIVKYFDGVNTRLNERPEFLNVMKDPSKGVQHQESEILWKNYQQDFPVVGKDGKINPENLKKWPLYTTPAAIASVKATGTYHPSKQASNAMWVSMPPDKQHPTRWNAPVQPKNYTTVIRKAGATPI